MISITGVPVAHPSESGYGPYPLIGDGRRLGLHTSRIPTGLGLVSVRHGRARGRVAMILLHGAAGSWTTWTPFLRAAEDVAPGQVVDLIIPDLPGWGDTPLPADASAASIESLASTVAEIACALGYEQWQVIGHSLGGFVALELAGSRPAETVHVGLISATTYGVIESARQPLARFGVVPGFSALLGVMRVLARFGKGGTTLVRTLHRLGLLRVLVAPLFHRTGRIDGSVIDALAAEARPRSFALAADRAARYDADRSWARIVCPVRAVHGDRDVFVPDGDYGRMAAVIADFRGGVLPSTGHFGHVERPFAVYRALWPAAA
jgi:pimeloyl-ACP methyl ester carboxylesterase